MSRESKRLAGILLVVFPTVVYGGVTLLQQLISAQPGYVDNPMRQDLWRAGHAHAGVLLVLSLVLLRYVDEAKLSTQLKAVARHTTPLAAILIPAAYFLSIASPAATRPSSLIYLTLAGALVLAVGFVLLGVGLLRR